MLYSLEQDGVEKKILEQCRREGLPLPQRIQNAPQLFFGLDLFYTAYWDLFTSRTGMGDGPIPWQVIEEYAIINQYSEDQKDDLHYYIVQLDDVFLKWRKKKNGKTK